MGTPQQIPNPGLAKGVSLSWRDVIYVMALLAAVVAMFVRMELRIEVRAKAIVKEELGHVITAAQARELMADRKLVAFRLEQMEKALARIESELGTNKQ